MTLKQFDILNYIKKISEANKGRKLKPRSKEHTRKIVEAIKNRNNGKE